VKMRFTTPYHPQSNGAVERFHRRLKDSLRARLVGGDWPDHLPWVLLGLRAAPREDSVVSAAELVYGSPLSLPGQFLTAAKPPPSSFVRQLQSTVPCVADKSGCSPPNTTAGFTAVGQVRLRPLAAGVAGPSTRIPRPLSGPSTWRQILRHRHWQQAQRHVGRQHQASSGPLSALSGSTPSPWQAASAGIDGRLSTPASRLGGGYCGGAWRGSEYRRKSATI
jgi:hypothetical protein